MKKINILFSVIICLWICLAIIFGIFDLEISKISITYKDSQLAQLGAEYGNKIDKPLLYLGITILFGSIFNNIKLQQKIGFMMIIYAILNLSFVIIIDDEHEVFPALLLVILLCTFMLLTYNKNWRAYLSIGLSLIILIIFLNLIVEIMKFAWGRVRFNDLSSDAEFTPWYIINGNGSERSNESFPSGHTAIGWSFLPLLYLLKNKKIKQTIKLSLVSFVLGFGLLVAISRVLMGEHYASDVLFSTGLASTLTIILYKSFKYFEFKKMDVSRDLLDKAIELKYLSSYGQWIGHYINKNGIHNYIWFQTYNDAIDYLRKTNLLTES